MNKVLYRILLLLSALSLAGITLFYFTLPSEVPLNWNIYGTPDSWGGKWHLLLIGATPLLSTILLRALPAMDPRSESYQKHKGAYGVFTTAVCVMLIITSWAMLLGALGISVPVDRILYITVGAAVMVLGNFLPQLRTNFFIGFRTPWTLHSDTVWRKTHRLAGVLWCICGALICLGALWGGTAALVMVFLLIGVCVFLFVYSYILYKKEAKGDDHNA